MSILDPESASSGEIKIEGGDSRAHIAQTSPSSQGNHTESALSLAHITSSKKNRPSLFDVSLEVFPGRITAIAGYPGSGLDALEDILSGMITADGGDIRIGSKKIPLARVSPALLRRKGVAAVPSDRAFRGSNPDITVRELLCAYRSAPFLLRNREDGDFVREVISREGIDVESARLVRTLSGGQLQRLILARELSTDPAVIVLSSPEWGLDIKSAELLRKRLMDIAMRGTAVLILSEETGSGGLFASDHILKDGRLS